VNRGILEAHAAGTVSSVSALVTAPGWADAVRALRRLGASLGVGLHFNLTAGTPLSDRSGRGTGARTLVDARTGRFHALPALIARALAGRIDPAEVAAECAAQLVRLRDAGATVTHLDGHRHVHVLPGVWRPVVETARAHGVTVVRVPLEPLATHLANWRALLKKIALAAAWRVAAGPGARPRHADRFYGLSLQGDAHFLERLLALLDRLAPGTTELMVHPGYVDGGLAGWDDYTAPRVAELAALTSAGVVARFRSGRFRLVHFGAL
jgi:predicted glycoside hydrolase/deacetylase ChbG (UPF0249 family)